MICYNILKMERIISIRGINNMKLVIHNEISNLTAKRVAAAALEGIDIPEGYRVNHHNGDLIIEPDDLDSINLTGELNECIENWSINYK